MSVIAALDPDSNPKSMAGVYRTRYFAEAVCEYLEVCFVTVAPTVWQSHYLKGEIVKRGKGEKKKAYKAKAKRLHPTLASNEDRCAAFGILDWYENENGKRKKTRTK